MEFYTEGKDDEFNRADRSGLMGRFPANLLISDDVLNDGNIRISGKSYIGQGGNTEGNPFTKAKSGGKVASYYPDSGSFSRYFDLDKWFEERIKLLPKSVQKIFPFLIVPKASKSEKNKGCEDLPEKQRQGVYDDDSYEWQEGHQIAKPTKNNHPTVKPLKLMSYLITLGSREGDLILDPFMGSGTTGIACKLLDRDFIGCEISKEYFEIAQKRIENIPNKFDIQRDLQ